MINRKRESGFFNPFVLAITAMALCLVLAIRTTAALTPVTATHDTWTTETDGPYGYFPPHLLDRSREFELMPDMFE
jgi:hypothetical protein